MDRQLSYYDIDATEIIDWYLESRYDYKIKVYVPYSLGILVANFRFTCNFYPPVTYKGALRILE